MKKTIWVIILILFVYGYINLFIIKPFFSNATDRTKIQEQLIINTGHKNFQIKIYQNDTNDTNYLSKFNIQLISR